MGKSALLVGLLCGFVLGISANAQLPSPCPTTPVAKLSLLIPCATQTAGSTLESFNTTFATELSSLPTVAPPSGFTLSLDKSTGVYIVSAQNLGSVLSQNADTVGKNKLFVGFAYEQLHFDRADGISLRNIPTFGDVTFQVGGTETAIAFAATNHIDATIDLYTILATFGLGDRVDLSVSIPIERVSVGVFSEGTEYFVANGANNRSFTEYVHGTASGIGDFVLGGKATIIKGERFRLAGGLDVRFATGDQANFLGSGAYGFKPYVIASRPGRISPHASLAYQWNSQSSLYPNPNPGAGGNLRLPDSMMYEVGADVGVVRKRLSFVADFLGQHFFDALKLTSPAPAKDIFTVNPPNPLPQTVGIATGVSNSQDNLGLGLKVSPFGRLIITGHVLIRLDDAGLRSNVVPLVGISYRF